MLNLKAAVNIAIASAIYSLLAISLFLVISGLPSLYLLGSMMFTALVASAILVYRTETARLEFLKKLNKKD